MLNSLAFSQSGREFRRSAIIRGNLVKCVFGNWGVLGQPSSKGSRGAWIYDNNGYIGDVSPLVGAEVTMGDTTFHSVVICPADRPTRQREESPTGEQWGFEPIGGYLNENQESIALYSDPDSWPAVWPDKLDDPEDPGWAGSWNGFFGKTTTASEECYFVMDDNNDKEFNFAENNLWDANFKPDAYNTNRNGLGLKVKVRGMQWADFLAQDVIFWLYEITNESTTDYSKVVFGMLVGTYVGVTSTESYEEYNDDYSFFDVANDITYTGDYDDKATRNPLWTGDVGVVGYAFLESPGNPVDGIDNDGDADTNAQFPATAPLFEEDDFEPRVIAAGDQLVLIDENYDRRVVTVPDTDTTFVTRGKANGQTYEVFISPGTTMLAEGNVVFFNGEEVVSDNAFDGIDNDLDGLIDENIFVHYRQLKKDQNGNVLIDLLSPVRYVDYITGRGVNDELIDEKRDDGIDNDGDWNPDFDDIGADGVIGTNDFGENDGVPTAGEPNFDATDVDESDQIGLTSFEYFTPANDVDMSNDEELWDRLAPGHFEVPESIVNNKPQRGEDGDFFYGSGYFPLRAGETQRFSLALVYGEGGGKEVDIVDLLNNRETAQKIYDSDYRFPPAPNKPTIRVEPGDGQVTIYWDRKAERSFDPVLKEYDFEGYKVYKATDNNFNEIFNITDGSGIPIAYEPIAQFDLKNGIEGYFRAGEDLYAQSKGATFYLGNDSGIEHKFVDTDVENGRRYFYAVVAYDRGNEETDIFPKENNKRIDIQATGEVKTFQNTAVATPRATVLGYTPPEGSVTLSSENEIVGTGKIYYKVLDETALTGHTYRVEFLDTSNDLEDNDEDWNPVTDDLNINGVPDAGEPNVDLKDPEEYFAPTTTYYSVRDLTGVTEEFQARDTIYVRLENYNLIEGTVSIKDRDGAEVSLNSVIIDYENGKIRGKASRDLRYGDTYSVTYQYYPVFESPYMEYSPWVDETLDSDIFDGLYLSFNNHWNPVLDTLRSGWSNPKKAYRYNITIIDTYLSPTNRLLGIKHQSDYQIEFSDSYVDSSATIPELYITGEPVPFKIYNKTDKKYIDFVYLDNDRSGNISMLDELVFVEKGENDTLLFTWDVTFSSTVDTLYEYGSGDTLKLSLKKPFRTSDVFEFTIPLATVDEDSAKNQLEQIRVVPNPYVVAHAHEMPLPPAITSGRGEREIEFRHLPAGADIYIYTSRGEHVVSLTHTGSIHDGTVAWNLKTKENLDVAAGIYFYVIKSSVGIKRGKIAIIK